MTLRLLFVRHGQSSFNTEQRVQGRDNTSFLTSKGEEQAVATGTALANVEIDALYSSPLKRAASTTSFVMKQLKNTINPSFDKDLLEVELDPWSGMTKDEIKDKFPKEYRLWNQLPEELYLIRKNGTIYKPIEDLLAQSKRFLDKLINNHSIENSQTILIVAHNAILRALILELIGQPKSGFRRLRLDNASLSILNLIPNHLGSYTCQIECLNNTSHLGKNLPSKGPNGRIILVRHGETNWNLEGRFQGQIDIPLNATGKSQAEAAGVFLSKANINKAFSSSLKRPIETAEKILKFHSNINLVLHDELLEISHGLWEGKLESEISRNWSRLLEEWKISPEKVTMPEGESIQEVSTRSIQCWEKICANLKDEDTALIVAHDAVNKAILCHLLGLTPGQIWMVKQGNGGVTVIDVSNDSKKPDVVTCLNLTSHLGGIFDTTASGAL